MLQITLSAVLNDLYAHACTMGVNIIINSKFCHLQGN